MVPGAVAERAERVLVQRVVLDRMEYDRVRGEAARLLQRAGKGRQDQGGQCEGQGVEGHVVGPVGGGGSHALRGGQGYTSRAILLALRSRRCARGYPNRTPVRRVPPCRIRRACEILPS